MVVSSTIFKYSLVIGCTLSLLPFSQGAWRNLVSSWTDSGAQWTGSTPSSDAIFHYGPVRLWTPAINSGHYEITSRVYSNSGFGCGHVFKYKTGSTRTRRLVTKAWGYYLSYGSTIRITTTGTEYSPLISYRYPTNQWNNLRTVVQGTRVTMYINNKLVKQVNMQGTGANSSSDNYVGLWCHSSTRERGRDFSVRDLAVCPKLAVNNHVNVSPSKCVTSSSSIGTTCSFRCSRGFKLQGPSYKRCGSGGRWKGAGASVRCIGAWRNLVSSWTDSGAQWTGSTPSRDAVFHFGPVRLWTPAINSGHYEITSRVYSNSGFGCGHVFKYKTGSTRTRRLVTKAWGYYLSYGSTIRITTTGTEYSPLLSYRYSTNQWNNLRTVVQGTRVTMYINNKLVKQVNMQGTGANSSSDNYVGLWCHSSTRERGRDFSVRDLAVCPKLAVSNHANVSPSKCVTSSSSIGTTCSFRCSRGFKLQGPSYKRCGSGGRWTDAGASVGCIVPGTLVTCAPNHIQISLPKARLPGVLVEDLQLLDPSCRATENSTHFKLKTLFNQCGTLKNMTSSSIIYTNKVIGRPLAKNATITRIRELEVSFTCSYSRTKKLMVSRFQRPRRNKLIFNIHVRGNFSFSFRFFPNSSFHKPYGNISVPLRLRQPMFFEVSVKSKNRELDVFAQDCYATPFNNVTHPKHWLIKHGCLVDSTLKALNTSSPSIQRFTFQAFRFVGNYRHLYFHCHVTACNGNDVKSVCVRGCVKGKPVKREEKGRRLRLIQGPFTLKKGTI